MKGATCYKCGKKGHISKYCRASKKIQGLNLGNEVLEKLSALLIETSKSKINSKDFSNKGEVNEIRTTSYLESESFSNLEDKQLNMLTRE